MRRLLRFTAAAALTACAAPAAALSFIQVEGRTDKMFFLPLDVRYLDRGFYNIAVELDRTNQLEDHVFLQIRYALYCDPLPTPCGGNAEEHFLSFQHVGFKSYRSSFLLQGVRSYDGGYQVYEADGIAGAFTLTDQVDTGFRITIARVPEPATWGMLILGFSCVGMAARAQGRRRFA
jgi:hypothetical protein